MKRNLWATSLSTALCPPWPCVACGKGHLRLRQDSLAYEETAESKRWEGSEEWVPEQVEFTFSAWAQCTNERCNEAFVIAGTGGIEQEYTGDDDVSTEWVNHYYPKAIIPTLQMIELPAKCPKVVKGLLFDAFACYWSQTDASAGRIRAALEALLTHVGVPTEQLKDSGKTIPLYLHTRIQIYAKENPMIGQQLMAIKWLGLPFTHM